MLIVLFTINIFWLSLSFMTALAGFGVIVSGARRSLVGPKDYDPRAALTGRTALIVCTYNEAPARIFGMAVATMNSIAKLGQQGNFDLFVLSDTTDPDIWVQEEAAFQAVREREACGHRIFYRRRSANTGKKAGNVADWCRRWGANYEYMLVLDADSLMTGERVAEARGHYREETRISASCRRCRSPSGGTRLFARLQQFAGRLYGPMLATGLAFWHRGVSNFWGHNAIIRTRAFIESAGLPMLPGKPPFGGQILSHDFVEAALLNRAGWRVVMVPDLLGSYEEIPPSLIDFAMRDRRWAQGNLQHSRVLFATAFIGEQGPYGHGHHGLHLGIVVVPVPHHARLSLTLQSIYTLPQYFSDNFSLFPKWPMQDTERSLQLLIMTLSVLLLPKLFAYVLVLMDGGAARFGGAFILLLGVLMETVLSSLFAHIMMLLQSSAVADVFRGRDSGWKPQRRNDGSLPFSEIMQFHLVHILTGAALTGLTLTRRPSSFFGCCPLPWASIFSGPLSAWSARKSAGESFRAPWAASDRGGKAAAHDCWRRGSGAKRSSRKAFWKREAITQLAESAKLSVGFIASSFRCNRCRSNPGYRQILRSDEQNWTFPQI